MIFSEERESELMRFDRWIEIPEDSVPIRWQGGPFRPRIRFPAAFEDSRRAGVISVLENYLRDCGKWFVFFEIVRVQLRNFDQKMKPFMKPEHRDSLYAIGGQLPDQTQLPGKSTPARMTQGQLLEALVPNGDFDSVLCRSLLVFLYSRWEESYRKSLAETSGVAKSCIWCDLMGEVRKVRNFLVHRNNRVPKHMEYSFEVLPWKELRGHWELTPEMFTSFMEQANSLEVRIEPLTNRARS